MKKIWLINPYGPIEGENWREYSFNQFGKFLSQKGYDVIWWTANFSHHFKQYRSEGWKDLKVNDHFTIRLVPTTSYKKNFGFGRIRKDFAFAKHVKKKCKNCEKPDLILAAENPLTMGRPSYAYARKNSIPYIYDQMDIWPEFIVKSLKKPLSQIADVLFRPVYRNRQKMYDHLDGAVALGKHYLEFMYEVSPVLKDRPSALVYNGIDVTEFRSHLGEEIAHPKVNGQKEPEQIWCVFAGTLGPSYDIPTIIACAEALEQEGHTSIQFLIAGSGPYEELVRCAEERLHTVKYLGKLLPEQLIPIYGKCDIGLSTYTAGSNVDMPDKFYDYTAAGLAVINSLQGEIKEHIEDRKLGCNYVAGDPESLRRAVISVCDPKNLQTYKQNAFDAAFLFDKNVQNEKLLKVIEEII